MRYDKLLTQAIYSNTPFFIVQSIRLQPVQLKQKRTEKIYAKLSN